MTQEDFSGDDEKDNEQEKVETSSENPDTEKDGRRQTVGKLFLSSTKSSRKILLGFLLCAAVFCLGVLMTRLTQNQSQFVNCLNSTLQKDGKNHSGPGLRNQVPLDPCDDFYEFACASLASTTNPTTIEGRFLLTVQLILGHGYAENGAEEKAQNFYRSCVHAAADPDSMLLNEKLTEMLEKLDKIPPGNLQEKLELFQNDHGFNSFFTWSIYQDDEVDDDDDNLDSNAIQIYLRLNDLKDEGNIVSLLTSSDQIKTVMTKILGHRLNFTDKSNASDFEKLVNLDREIQELRQPALVEASALKSNSSMNPLLNFNVSQLQTLAGFINWKDFLNSGLKKSSLNFTISDDTKVVVLCSQCFSKLSEKLNHLANSTAESQKLLDKFLIWQAGKEILGQIFVGVNSPAAATTICSTLTTKHYKLPVASMHRRYFLKQNPDLETHWIKMAHKMAENIRDELILVLKESDWLDETSRDGAIVKARKTQVRIGYPDSVRNSTQLEELYEAFPETDQTDFIGNMMTLWKYVGQKGVSLPLGPVDLNEDLDFDLDSEFDVDVLSWSSVLDDNAFAFKHRNTITIPVRNLLPPNFAPKSSESYNYGRLGFTIGHEFFHGFDNSGSQWDGDVKFQSQVLNPNAIPMANPGLWQTEETREEMENRSSCLVRQYSKFSYPDGTFLNGTQTLEENFADNGGLDVVTRALFRLLNRKEINRNIKNIKKIGGKDQRKKKVHSATDKQMFFISFAQSWCTDEPPKFINDPHAPHKFRVLGSLQNSKDFAEAFNCTSKSRMNPQDKCSLF